ncbi:MAG: FtsQ-type POTRA domain-containing protein [Oscillospiraceae bacterium]
MDKTDEKQQLKKDKRAAAKKPPKRITHKLARKRRFIKGMITAVVTAIILIVCVIMSFKLLFIVRSVEVTGSELFSKQDITDFCAIEPESNIFKVDTKELEKKLTEEFTYIETARVQKKFPDKIAISIVDSIESYYTVAEDGVKIYSQSFRFLRSSQELPENMLCLDCDITKPEIIDIAIQLIEVFKTYEIEGITTIKIAGTSDIKAVYQNRLEIDFGTMLDIDYKAKMCKKLLEEKISTEEKGTLDATKAGEVVYKRQ